MLDIEKGSKFLKNFEINNNQEQLKKQKENLLALLKITLKLIDNDIDLETLNNLDDSQIWAFIFNNSSKTINDFKSKSKNIEEVLEELSLINSENNEKKNDKKVLGKKKKRIEEEIGEEEEDENMENDKEEEENEEEDENGNEGEDEGEDEVEDDDEGEDEDENMNEKLKNKKDKSDNKDIFFSLKDLNNFADQFEEEDNNNVKSAPNRLKISSSRNKQQKKEDMNEEEEEEEDNNSLYSEEQRVKAEIDSEEEIKFDKFFDKPDKKKKDNNLDSEDSDVDENEIFSQIKEIEEKMISNKKEWSTRGEIMGKERPKDSLLTKAMDFEVGLKAPPIPDREYTDKLESMIKQRIKDDLFDDPIKKQIINLNENKNIGDNELNFDKSKKGLGEIYEEKYLGNEKTEGKMDEIKKECDDLCDRLFDIFKQMTNGSANPYGNKQRKEEINITNLPAIQIEELGNFVSDNKDKIKSGREMFNPNKIRNKNKEEMTAEELRNIHNRKKRNIKSRIHEKEQKRRLNELTQKLGSKFEAKIKMKQDKDKKMQKVNNTTEYKSSKFFGKINEMAEKEGEKRKKND